MVNKREEISALELIEEAISFLRTRGFWTLSLYWLGTVPFVVLFLFFWSDMAHDAFAKDRLATYCFALAFLYGWMKYWQTRFSRSVRYQILNQLPPSETFKEKIWNFLFQGAFQPTQWILLPLSKLIIFPFGFMHAFYETLHASTTSANTPPSKTISETWKLSLIYPLQNHILIWLMSPWTLIFGFSALFGCLALLPYIRPELKELPMQYLQNLSLMFLAFCAPLSPFGILIFANIALILFGIPFVLQTFLGAQSQWTISGFALTDPFFIVVCLSLTYLVMDPILKTTYVLRHFYGQSFSTGEDLLLQHRKKTAFS